MEDVNPSLQMTRMMMKKKSDQKFSWCPVCMIHTYHHREKGEWQCVNSDHQALLRLRTDPWIEEYRQARVDRRVSVESEV